MPSSEKASPVFLGKNSGDATGKAMIIVNPNITAQTCSTVTASPFDSVEAGFTFIPITSSKS